ncbi:MAG: hypothetical protein ACKPCM_13670 [Pseudanabaena sp.]
MILLNSLNQVRSIIINTITGTEKAIVVLGKFFIADRVYNSVQEAIAACRGDLDLGKAIVIAPDENQFKVWVMVPNELILQVF